MMPTIAVVLHIALVAAMAPFLEGLLRQIQARSANELPPPWQQPWRDLVRLWRKPGLVPSGAWFVFAAAPAVAFGAAAAAAVLTPGFSAAVGAAGVADLVVVAGLLGLSRLVPALAAFDAGALVSFEASRAAAARLPAAPVFLLAALAAVLVSGSSALGAGPVRDGAMALLPGGLAGLALMAWAAQDGPAPALFSGRDLALITAAAQVRRVAALSLAASVGLPFGMAGAGADVEAWFVGACCWMLKLGVLGGVAATLGRHRMVLPAAALLALIAAVIVGVQGRA